MLEFHPPTEISIWHIIIIMIVNVYVEKRTKFEPYSDILSIIQDFLVIKKIKIKTCRAGADWIPVYGSKMIIYLSWLSKLGAFEAKEQGVKVLKHNK